MGKPKKTIFRWKKPVGTPAFRLSTTSALAVWSPEGITNAGPTLTWDATGAVVDNIVADDPTFDLSSSGGGVTFMEVTAPDDISWIKIRIKDIETVNLYDVPLLNNLDLYGNNLLLIDLSNNPLITQLDLGENNSLSSLDVSNLLVLDRLIATNCNLSSLDLRKCTVFDELWIGGNNFTAIDLSQNTALTRLVANDNVFTSLDLTNNPLIFSLSVFNNPTLGSLDLSSQGVACLSINVSNCGLSSLTVSNLTAILNITCSGNASLTTLDLSANTVMTTLICHSCGLSTLDISNNIALNGNVWVYGNGMSPATVDQLIIDLASFGNTTGTQSLRCGNNRTSASDAAVTTLQTDGWTVNESDPA